MGTLIFSYHLHEHRCDCRNLILSLFSLLQSYHLHWHYCRNNALASLLSVPLARHSSEEDVPPFYVLLSTTEWSGPEFMYHSNAASNQATKPKLRGVHKVLQNQHQHCHDCEKTGKIKPNATKSRKICPPFYVLLLMTESSHQAWPRQNQGGRRQNQARCRQNLAWYRQNQGRCSPPLCLNFDDWVKPGCRQNQADAGKIKPKLVKSSLTLAKSIRTQAKSRKIFPPFIS